MRHPKLIIAGLGVALAAAGGTTATSRTSTGTLPPAPSGGGYSGY